MLSAEPALSQSSPSPAEVSKIAEEAFVYGLPLVMNYTVFYEYFIDKTGAQYKAPPNQLYNTARVYTPQDTAIVTPNSDTPYSFVAMDLRAEPFMVCNPDIEASRYFSVQLVNMYTFNFGYMGSRTTGNHAGCNMITGPGWKGEKPDGVGQVFASETDFAFALIRTQLFSPADIDNVKKIQAGYRALALSQFQNKPTPPAAPEINWPKIDKQMAAADPFAYLNFVLTLSPPIGPAAVEIPLRERFAKIGVEAGKPFPAGELSADQKTALELGVKNGLERSRPPSAVSASRKMAGGSPRMASATATPTQGISLVAPPRPPLEFMATTRSKPSIRCSQRIAKARSPTPVQTATR